jgi:hypothetical protein
MSEVSEVAKSMNFNREVSVTSVGKTDKNTFLGPRFAQKPNADSALFRFNNAKNAYNLICKVPFSLQTLLYTLPMERVYIIQTISNVCRQERIYHILSWSKDVANATAFTCGRALWVARFCFSFGTCLISNEHLCQCTTTPQNAFFIFDGGLSRQEQFMHKTQKQEN